MGQPPGDFWTTHPVAFWWAVEALMPERRTRYAGGMSESEVADLYDWCMSEG